MKLQRHLNELADVRLVVHDEHLRYAVVGLIRAEQVHLRRLGGRHQVVISMAG